MTNEEIEKLKKKAEKDPRSKLFVPLAEAYKQRDMIDEAIEVLFKGIDDQPEYASARVALGKIYLDKEMLTEARDEFEKVIKLIPDNLLANKRLAYIYREQGEHNMAVEKYQIVLGLSPNDVESVEALESLKSRSQTPVAVDEPGEDGLDDAEKASSEQPEKKKSAEPVVYEIDDEVNGSELGVEIPDKLKPVSEEPVTDELEEYRKTVETHSQTAVETTARPDYDQPKNDKIVISMRTSTMADIFISQGLYDKAMNVYKEMLSSDPENSRLIQRRKELEMLIKLKAKHDRG
ncbi:MAG TPA: tetratricopeptide repeat protein [Nitrospirae bacterium]|nr:tetratricopeptide repeat protein [Nitrospirota bacterium]